MSTLTTFLLARGYTAGVTLRAGTYDFRRYGTFRLNFHRFDRFELDLRGNTQP